MDDTYTGIYADDETMEKLCRYVQLIIDAVGETIAILAELWEKICGTIGMTTEELLQLVVASQKKQVKVKKKNRIQRKNNSMRMEKKSAHIIPQKLKRWHLMVYGKYYKAVIKWVMKQETRRRLSRRCGGCTVKFEKRNNGVYCTTALSSWSNTENCENM